MAHSTAIGSWPKHQRFNGQGMSSESVSVRQLRLSLLSRGMGGSCAACGSAGSPRGSDSSSILMKLLNLDAGAMCSSTWQPHRSPDKLCRDKMRRDKLCRENMAVEHESHVSFYRLSDNKKYSLTSLSISISARKRHREKDVDILQAMATALRRG